MCGWGRCRKARAAACKLCGLSCTTLRRALAQVRHPRASWLQGAGGFGRPGLWEQSEQQWSRDRPRAARSSAGPAPLPRGGHLAAMNGSSSMLIFGGRSDVYGSFADGESGVPGVLPCLLGILHYCQPGSQASSTCLCLRCPRYRSLAVLCGRPPLDGAATRNGGAAGGARLRWRHAGRRPALCVWRQIRG